MTTRRAYRFDVKEVADARGALGALELGEHLDFPVRRFYFLHRVPDGAERGFHAHRALDQVMIALRGAVEVLVDDGLESRRFQLDSPTVALRIPPMHWRELREFSPDALVAVLASERYDEDDYIRDYDTFRALARARSERGPDAAP